MKKLQGQEFIFLKALEQVREVLAFEARHFGSSTLHLDTLCYLPNKNKSLESQSEAKNSGIQAKAAHFQRNVALEFRKYGL